MVWNGSKKGENSIIFWICGTFLFYIISRLIVPFIKVYYFNDLNSSFGYIINILLSPSLYLDSSIFIIIYLTLFSLIITVVYQLVRKKLFKKIEAYLKEDMNSDSINFAKDLGFFIGKPDLITTAILWSIPIVTFIITYLPRILYLFIWFFDFSLLKVNFSKGRNTTSMRIVILIRSKIIIKITGRSGWRSSNTTIRIWFSFSQL